MRVDYLHQNPAEMSTGRNARGPLDRSVKVSFTRIRPIFQHPSLKDKDGNQTAVEVPVNLGCVAPGGVY